MIRKLLHIALLAVLITACNSITEPEPEKPQFDELTISDISATAIRWASWRVVKDTRNYRLQEIGFMYSTNPEIPVEKADKCGTEYKGGYYNFGESITGLTPNTTYYACLYCVTNDGKYFKGESQTFKTREQGDFSQVTVQSPLNDNVQLHMIGCYRQSNTSVLVEVAITNNAIQNNSVYRIYYPGYGDNVDGRSYITYIQDDQLTDYVEGSVVYEMNGDISDGSSHGAFFGAGALPLGSTKKLKITVSGVPAAAQQLSLHIMSYFYNYPDYQKIYMVFKNVPIY